MRKVRNLSLVLTNGEVKKLLHGTQEEHDQVIQELEEKLSALYSKDVSSTEVVTSLTIASNTPLTFFKRILTQFLNKNKVKKEKKKKEKTNGKRKNKRNRK